MGTQLLLRIIKSLITVKQILKLKSASSVIKLNYAKSPKRSHNTKKILKSLFNLKVLRYFTVLDL